MIKILKIAVLAALALVLGGCAHPLVISPDLSQITTSSDKIGKNVSYYFTDDLEKEVITPGGGGDMVKYKPYKDLDTGVYKMFSNTFQNASYARNKPDSSQTDLDYIAAVTISTSSSSSSAFTWIPTLFTVNLNVDFTDVRTERSTKLQVAGEGRAEYSEFKTNFNLTGKRASEDAINKMSSEILKSELSTPRTLDKSPVSTQTAQSKENRLRELKRLYDEGLIDSRIYSDRQKSILAGQ